MDKDEIFKTIEVWFYEHFYGKLGDQAFSSQRAAVDDLHARLGTNPVVHDVSESKQQNTNQNEE